MIESPLIQEIKAKVSRKVIGLGLEGRFGAVPQQLVTELSEVLDSEKLDELTKFAGSCNDLKAFRKRLRELQSAS